MRKTLEEAAWVALQSAERAHGAQPPEEEIPAAGSTAVLNFMENVR